MKSDQLTIRRARPEDRHAVLELLAASLGWACDETFASFFAWKHEQNPFGPSPAWVATDGDRIAGFRTFLQWRFEHPDGRVRRAVRAVDTATAPDYQGRGVFRQLTLQAVAELTDDGFDFVFNTPNDKSRPGYLKMGWVQAGRVAVEARIAGLRSARRMLGARVAADRWSIPVDAGVPAADGFRDPALTVALSPNADGSKLRTEQTIAFLQWRYAYDRFHYRLLPVADDPAAGFVVFRVRRRGTATEATVCEIVCGAGTPRISKILRTVLKTTNADYAIVARRSPLRDRVAPMPGQGPILTLRPLAEKTVPDLDDLALSLGDVEAL